MHLRERILFIPMLRLFTESGYSSGIGSAENQPKKPRKWRAKSTSWRHGEEVITPYVVTQHYLCMNGCFSATVELPTPTY